LTARLQVAAAYVVPFLVMLVTTIPNGVASRVGVYPIPLLSTSDQVRQVLGGSDAGSLLEAAMSWHQYHALANNLFGVYSSWPPGMVIVDSVLLEIEGATGIPFVLLMVLTNSLLWASLIGTFVLAVRAIAGLTTAMVFGAVLFLYSGVSVWGAQTGLFFSDSFGAIGYGFALIALFCAARSTAWKRRVLLVALAGVAMAAASYFRASYELVAEVSIGGAALAVAALLLVRAIRRVPRRNPALLVPLISIALAGAVAQLLMLPWRIYLGLKVHPGDFRWSTVSDLMSLGRWVPDAELLKRNGNFLIVGHSNWGCINDPQTCAEIQQHESATANPYSMSGDGNYRAADFDHFTLQSFLAHPIDYVRERLGTLVFGYASNTGMSVGTFAVAESLLILAVFALVVVIAIRRRTIGNAANLFFLMATVVQLATLALVHMEARYFLGVELGVLLFGGLVLAEDRVRTRGRPAAAKAASRPPLNPPNERDASREEGR
jgi:hypothetical protein